MIEPVALENFAITFLSAALVILSGAGYGALFAWSRLRRRRNLMLWAYAFYGALAMSVLTLANAAHLTGSWRILVAVMLLGYLLAPHAIWRLCEGTHPLGHDGPGELG